MNYLLRGMLGLFFDRDHFPPREGGVRAMRPWIKALWFQKILKFNKDSPWPMSPQAKIGSYENIHFPVGEVHNFQSPGIYLQNFDGHIHLEMGVYIGPNVGLITANHDPRAPKAHLPGSDIRLSEGTWIGMNSVVLPGVTLGPGTVVAAGSVVTKSFPEGHVLVAGTPARVVKRYEESASD